MNAKSSVPETHTRPTIQLFWLSTSDKFGWFYVLFFVFYFGLCIQTDWKLSKCLRSTINLSCVICFCCRFSIFRQKKRRIEKRDMLNTHSFCRCRSFLISIRFGVIILIITQFVVQLVNGRRKFLLRLFDENRVNEWMWWLMTDDSLFLVEYVSSHHKTLSSVFG